MIRHCVFLKLASEADQVELSDVMAGLSSLVADLGGCKNFVAGPNRDFESKSPDHAFGFTFDAMDAETLSVYANHQTHKALGARLVALCEGGGDGIMVYDIESDIHGT